MKYRNILLTFLLFFLGISCEVKGAAGNFPSYEEIAVYAKRPIVLLDGQSLDFTKSHESMAKSEFVIYSSQKDSDKNFFILRFAPVYEDGLIGVPIEISHPLGDSDRELIFMSSAANLTLEEQAKGPSQTFPQNDTFRFTPTSDKLDWKGHSNPNPNPKLFLLTEAYASGLKKLKAILIRRFPDYQNDQSPLVGWYHSLILTQRIDEISQATDDLGAPGDINLGQVAQYSSKVKEIVKAKTGRGSFCCSEQNAFRHLCEGLPEILGKINAQNTGVAIKALVISGHTTKHPCRMCGLTMHNEFNAVKEGTLAKLLYEGITQKTQGMKIMGLVSYRESYEGLPNSSGITLSDTLNFTQLDSKFALIKLKVEPVLSLTTDFDN